MRKLVYNIVGLASSGLNLSKANTARASGDMLLAPDDFAPTPPADFLPEAVSALDLARSLSLTYVQGNTTAELTITEAFNAIAAAIQSGPDGDA